MRTEGSFEKLDGLHQHPIKPKRLGPMTARTPMNLCLSFFCLIWLVWPALEQEMSALVGNYDIAAELGMGKKVVAADWVCGNWTKGVGEFGVQVPYLFWLVWPWAWDVHPSWWREAAIYLLTSQAPLSVLKAYHYTAFDNIKFLLKNSLVTYK